MFLKEECTDILGSLEVSVPDLIALSDQVKLWARSYRKLTQDRFWEKRMEDMSNMKKPQDVKKFDTSEVARNAVKILGEFQNAGEVEILSQTEYTAVRDYLMTEICIDNGSRSGSIVNMTLEEFNNASKEEDCHVVRVKKHKTFTTHGPANIVLSSSLYGYMLIFISKFRNQLVDADTSEKSAVFLIRRGTALDSSAVGAQISSCWVKVFGKEAAFGGATSIRKAVVSAVHENNESMRGDLANLMVHNKSTADRYYLLQDKGKSAARTSREVSRIMRDTSKSELEKNEVNTDRSLMGETPDIFTPYRHAWQAEEVSAIESLFSKNIEEQTVSLPEVKNLVKNHPVLGEISSKKIIDKVRSMFRKDSSEDHPDPPQENESTEEKLKRIGIQIGAGKLSSPCNFLKCQSGNLN